MQLAYVMSEGRGATDRVLSTFAHSLLERGVRLAGVAQSNTECSDSHLCDMDVLVLPDGPTIRISQSLGAGARGCRLDSAALEQAVGLVAASLDADPQLLIINKFGKQEAGGDGFRPVIAEAMSRGIPVLAGVNGLNRDAFLDFTGGLAEHLPDDPEALEHWFDAASAAVSDPA